MLFGLEEVSQHTLSQAENSRVFLSQQALAFALLKREGVRDKSTCKTKPLHKVCRCVHGCGSGKMVLDQWSADEGNLLMESTAWWAPLLRHGCGGESLLPAGEQRETGLLTVLTQGHMA